VNLIPFDELVEIWVRAHEEVRAACADDDLGWWREAMANLRPTLDEDATTAEDEDEAGAPGSSS
jgi:hypothetical protein